MWMLLPALLLAQHAHATFTQRGMEAEHVSGGTQLVDLDASNGTAVTRATDGIYAWWLQSTSDLTPGAYSVYARIALADGVSTSKSFNPQVHYGSAQLGLLSLTVSNRQYRWLRVGSFELPQVGEQLRISDWSNTGLKLDKLAFVKEAQLEAEATYNVPVVSDPAASGGRAVSRGNDGVYTWLDVPSAEVFRGDYEVHVRLRSSDGAPHTYTSHVTLDGTSLPTVSKAVSSTSYQWVKFNDFTYSGGTQTVRLSDYSQAGLVVDAVRLVRRTPDDRYAMAQALYAAGSMTLGAASEVLWNGIPNNHLVAEAGVPEQLGNEGRVSVVQVDANTIYVYFRQRWTKVADPPSSPFQIFMAISTDGGRTFQVQREPIIPVKDPNRTDNPSTLLDTAYDPQVTKVSNNKYYMVFEGAGRGCGFSAIAAESTDGKVWQEKNVPLCGFYEPGTTVSTPSYYVDPQTNTQYIQWVSISQQLTRRFQAPLPNGLFVGQLRFSTPASMEQYVLPQAPAGTWEDKNFGAGNIYYEDGYYYLVYEGANYRGCEPTPEEKAQGVTSQWGLGIARTATPSVLSSWTRSPRNPYMLAPVNTSCWMGYPQLVSLPGGLFLYYADFHTYQVTGDKYREDQYNPRVIFRKRLISN